MSNELFLFILLIIACLVFITFVIVADREYEKLNKEKKYLSESLDYYRERSCKKDDVLNDILQTIKNHYAE